jgi:hypothetical protein
MSSYILPLPILLILFVATCFAAEPALPGGVLYWIKTDVSEPLRVAVSFDARTRAERNAAYAGRRLVEAEALAGQGRMDAGESAVLALRFGAYARAAYVSFDTLAVQDAVTTARLRAEFLAALTVHETIMRGMMRDASVWSDVLMPVAKALAIELHASEESDLYDASAHASATQIAEVSGAAVRAVRAAETVLRDAARQVEISGKGTGSIESAFVKNAEDLLAFSRREQDKAARRADEGDMSVAYVAHVSALNAASQAERFARAAYAIALGRDRTALRTTTAQ